MKKDIQNRIDLEKLIALFYEMVKVDEVIGIYFSEMVNEKWDQHLAKMLNFWENQLFHQNDYEGNPMTIHKTIDKKHKMTPKDFSRWIKLFNKSVDELFEGINADRIKVRASKIANIMRDSLLKIK